MPRRIIGHGDQRSTHSHAKFPPQKLATAHLWIILIVLLILTVISLSIKSFFIDKSSLEIIMIPAEDTTPSTTTPPPAAGYPASDGRILWEAGWETGDTSQWSIHAGRAWGNSSVEVVTHPVRWGNYAGKLTLHPSEGNEKRAEISASQEETGGFPGQEWYYSFAVYFPSSDPTTGWSQWNDFTQWMDLRAKCSPPVQFDITSGGTIVFIQETTTQESNHCGYDIYPSHYYNLGPVVYDQWIDFTASMKWSLDPEVGFAVIWRNGKLVLPKTSMPTMDPGGTGVYMEQAMYRPNTPGTSIIYLDGTRRHDAYTPSQ
jgi:hypothetical protein